MNELAIEGLMAAAMVMTRALPCGYGSGKLGTSNVTVGGALSFLNVAVMRRSEGL